MKLKDLGFTLLAIIGLGMAPVKNLSQDYGWQDGALYQRTRKPARDFTLAGYVSGATNAEVKRNRAQLEAALSPDNVTTQQPLTLLYDYSDECGNLNGETLSIPCLYRGGLEGKTDNLYAEKVPLNFTMFLPLVQRGNEEGAGLSYQTTVANANSIIQQKTSGIWGALGTGTAVGGTVYALAISQDGMLYAGGNFSSMGGIGGTAYIAKWNGTTWSALGTGANTSVYALAVGPDGTLYAGGNFTSMSGVANTAYIAKWNGTTWSALGTGADANVTSLAVGPDGTLYAGGNFTAMDGVGSTAKIAKWNGSAWSNLGTGANQSVDALAVGPDGTLYAGGFFTLMGGVTGTVYIAKWNGTTWSSLSSGADARIAALAIGLDGTLYAGGFFSTIGGVSATRIAKWNGNTWSNLGAGASAGVYTLTIGPGGALYAGGTFTSIGGIAPPDGVAIWNGSSWVYISINVPGSAVFYSMLYTTTWGLVLGYDTRGSATVPSITSTINNGSEITAPIITLTGPGTVYQIQNVTTGDTLYFNLTLLAGEVATLNLESGNISFNSTFRGNILSTILPGSNLASFKLLPGENTISVFVAGTTTAATAVDMRWTPQYLGLEH